MLHLAENVQNGCLCSSKYSKELSTTGKMIVLRECLKIKIILHRIISVV